MNLNDITFREITREESKHMLLNYHYLQRMPPLSVAYGAFNGNEMIGVLTFGKPPSNSLCQGICGEKWSSQVFELNRLYTVDNSPKNLESKFISYALKDLKPRNWIIVSYADMGMGHSGYIYQATNWIYTGLSAHRTDVYVGQGGHSRTYNQEQRKFVIRKVRNSKYRYVYFNGDKKFKREAMADLNYPIVEEYPKDEPSHYEIGEREKQYLYHKHTKDMFLESDFIKDPSAYLNEQELKMYEETYA